MTVNTTSAVYLQQQMQGRVLTPEDADYEQLRRGWNLTINQYPSLILVAETVEDVVAGVRYARETGLGVAVQSTGHGLQIPANNSLLILTSRLNAIEIDAQARTARMEAGVVWGKVVEKAVPYGLAPLLGSSPHVGVVGYTLGGGIGWLARKYGLAADSVRSIDLVTPDGVLRHTSPTENADLFWGLRGGGGNFGVVTALEVELFPVTSLYGGNLTYSGELAGPALRFYRDWIQTLPDEMTSSIAVLRFPSFPQVPAEMRGKAFVILRAAYVGDDAEGEAYIQQWLDWNPPLSNAFHTLPFSEIATVSNDPVDPAPTFYSNELLDGLSDEAIDVIVQNIITNPTAPLMVTELRHAGGAIARVPADSNAIGNRDAQLYMQMAGMAPTPEIQAAVVAYIQQYKAQLQPYLRGNVYLNFIKGHEATSRVKDAFLPESYKRLMALKAHYDPDLMFRFSYQLVPLPVAE
ncbi:MAG: FAD-binding oxidoreductase [Chloroflexi bacterium]|nr:FAD-binding oxidoreductase [Chloroflexota bacterium]